LRADALRDFAKLLSGNVLARAFGVAGTILFARVLSKDDMAVFPVYLMLNGVAIVVFDWGITPLFVRLLPSEWQENRERARSLLMTGSIIVVAGAAAAALVASVFGYRLATYFFHDAGKAWIVEALCIGFVPYQISKIVEYVLWSRAAFGVTSAIQVAESIVRPALNVACYFLWGYAGLVAALVVAQTVMALAAVWCIRDVFRGELPRLYPLRSLFAQSLPFHFDNYLYYLRGEGDNWLVTLLLGTEALAEYYVAKTLFSTMILVVQSLDKVVVQRFARDRNESGLLHARVQEVHRLTSQIVVPGVMLVLAMTPALVAIIGGRRYAGSTGPAEALMLVVLLQFLITPIDRAVFVSLSPLYRLARTALETLAVFATVLPLASLLGSVGIALARLVGGAVAGAYGWTLLRMKQSLTLSMADATRSLLISTPGTVTALMLFPRPENAPAALGWAGVFATLWVFLFASLTLLFNRSFLKDARALFMPETVKPIPLAERQTS
jgi:O-antigen/teichoic acid export membrane protein